MDIEPAHFEGKDIERYGMGAGVVPVALTPEGKLCLLLGRERWLPSWKGSCRWSGFEGARKSGESVRNTAVREFCEESLHVVCDAKSATQRLAAEDYWARVVIRILHDRRPSRYHCTYLLDVPWDPTVPSRFRRVRSDLEYVDRVLQEWRHVRPVDVLGEHGEPVGDVVVHEDGSATVWKRAEWSPCILRAPWGRDEENPHLVRATVSGVAAAEVRHWSLLRDRLTRALVDHPGLRVTRDAHWRHVQDVVVARDHLEKDQVRWWSVEELQAVMRGRGQSGMDRFRPYFLPVLQTILRELETRAPPRSGPLPPAETAAPPPPTERSRE